MGKKKLKLRGIPKKKKETKNSNSPIIEGITYENIKYIKNDHKERIIFFSLTRNKKNIILSSENKITLHSINTYEKLSEKKKLKYPIKKVLELENEEIILVTDLEYFFLKINEENNFEEIKYIEYNFPQKTTGLFQVNEELIAIGKESAIFFYDFNKFENIITLTPQNYVNSCVQLNNIELMMLLYDDSLSFYNLLTYDQVKFIQFNKKEFRNFLFLDNEDKNILFYYKNFIEIYNIENDSENLIQTKNTISCIIKLKEKKFIVVGEVNGNISIYNSDNYQNVITFQISNGKIDFILELSNERILFNDDKNKIILANYIKGTIYIKKKIRKLNTINKGILMDNNDLVLVSSNNFIILN